jgi:hypothetical protein
MRRRLELPLGAAIVLAQRSHCLMSAVRAFCVCASAVSIALLSALAAGVTVLPVWVVGQRASARYQFALVAFSDCRRSR